MTKDEMKIYRERKRKIIALHKRGVSHPEIARIIGLKNRQRVWQIINGK